MAPPQNLEAEQSVLGAVLLSDTALPALIIDERLNPDDFYREAHGRIYQAMLDLHGHGEPVDPSGQVPGVWFQGPGEEGESSPLPEQDHEQRWHLDVWVPHDEGERRLQAVLDAGGTLVSDAEAPAFWVVADADGNRSCICTRLTR